MSRYSFRIAINLFVITFALLAGFLQARHTGLIQKLCQEDGIVETTTAVFYMAASALFAWMAVSTGGYRRLWCLGFAALFFFVAAEEISWGQRILGFGTPESMQAANVQHEFNFHNLEAIHSNIRMIGLLVIGVLCFVMPVSNKLLLQSAYERLGVPVFPLWASGIVAIAIMFMAYPRFVLGRIIFAMDEVGELLLGIAFLCFALDAFDRVRTAPRHEVAGRGPAA